jgi:translation initiation factor IF-2
LNSTPTFKTLVRNDRQHLGAFVVKCGGGGELTFLDTPGHAAFSAMRRRGASVTDVAVLVCAADDGVMPQTREAAAHILAANCKFVVAITKCDRDGADPSRVRDELHAMGIALESHGGDVQCVEVSAMTGQGMEDLEMALFLEAEVRLLPVRPRSRVARRFLRTSLLSRAGNLTC